MINRMGAAASGLPGRFLCASRHPGNSESIRSLGLPGLGLPHLDRNG
jgi:hypothetical protein